MIGSIQSELLVLRKRTATWILLGIWTVLATMFAYVIPYFSLGPVTSPPGREQLQQLLPAHFVGNLSAGFPFYGGVFGLMLGVLTFGSEYGWGTFKTLFTQRPGRLRIFGAKLFALGITLIPFVVVIFAVGAVASVVIAQRESAPIVWPSLFVIVKAFVADWLILLVWLSFGVFLAVLSRGTALAIGVGILYSLVIEGLLSALTGSISLLEPLVKLFVRANAYSLVESLGVTSAASAENGPGSFSGPFVAGSQALLVLAAYLAAFLAISAILLRRRDVA
jgi:ABC-type transport system involved in multi-copper enzyme maturation permease subunit